MKINNKTNLSYKALGEVIDEYINSGYDDTLYAGKTMVFDFFYRDKYYRCHVRYLKKYVEYTFVEA